MVVTEYLAISSIFLGGFFLGLKIKGMIEGFKEYEGF